MKHSRNPIICTTLFSRAISSAEKTTSLPLSESFRSSAAVNWLTGTWGTLSLWTITSCTNNAKNYYIAVRGYWSLTSQSLQLTAGFGDSARLLPLVLELSSLSSSSSIWLKTDGVDLFFTGALPGFTGLVRLAGGFWVIFLFWVMKHKFRQLAVGGKHSLTEHNWEMEYIRILVLIWGYLAVCCSGGGGPHNSFNDFTITVLSNRNRLHSDLFATKTSLSAFLSCPTGQFFMERRFSIRFLSVQPILQLDHFISVDCNRTGFVEGSQCQALFHNKPQKTRVTNDWLRTHDWEGIVI